MTKRTENPIRPASAKQQHAMWKRLASQKVAMLTTHGMDGVPGARPVMPVKIEPEGRLWFFTALDGGLAHDVGRDPRVELVFMDHRDELYVSLFGHAQVMHDPRKARAMWSMTAGAWYPDGADDPNLALLRVDVRRGDYWDVKDGSLVQVFKLAAAAMTRTRADDVATHRRFRR